MKRSLVIFAVATTAFCASAKDVYVSLSSGKNKNAGTKEAPFKNIWKAVEKAQPGDVIHVAEGNYPGKMKCGWVQLDKPVSLVGGYSSDFSVRDPLKHKTMFQPKNDQNDKKGSAMALMRIDFKNQKGFKMLIDGLIFDDGFASSYHETKGKPEGFDTGMWLEGPAMNKLRDKFPSANRYSLFATLGYGTAGELEIRNCTFVNGSNFGVNINWFEGEVKMKNNVFCNNRMIGANVQSSNGQPGKVKWEFENNTVLFTWSRLNDLADMGFGVRVNANVEAEIENNIIGLNVLTGFDNTKGNGKTKKIQLDGNVFFLNRESDVQMTVSPSVAKVRVDGFEDLEGTDGIESIEDNVDLADPKVFAGRINAKYLNSFLSMKYSESTKLDEGKCNGLRSVLGLPLQGTIKTTCDMYANRYPMEDALKLFGAMEGKGAQVIK
ncbi:MAG: right-handed parallel beta-helix repeat-containing protein [Kiritimatiellae bacterium]|nr:right-handed parallel beta-helix repeat-containing protein [Kiritimatiellia bacterium]MBR3923598.1 right-handed parallel beta-helix repeat-containing protein [Kiritimatiellia bacterium]MBR6585840.1 right-handed parallel beta-helix repeat-containing protein [Kiritimatiellia bacterium]